MAHTTSLGTLDSHRISALEFHAIIGDKKLDNILLEIVSKFLQEV
jgi:hypothetical protein